MLAEGAASTLTQGALFAALIMRPGFFFRSLILTDAFSCKCSMDNLFLVPCLVQKIDHLKSDKRGNRSPRDFIDQGEACRARFR